MNGQKGQEAFYRMRCQEKTMGKIHKSMQEAWRIWYKVLTLACREEMKESRID